MGIAYSAGAIWPSNTSLLTPGEPRKRDPPHTNVGARRLEGLLALEGNFLSGGITFHLNFIEEKFKAERLFWSTQQLPKIIDILDNYLII